MSLFHDVDHAAQKFTRSLGALIVGGKLIEIKNTEFNVPLLDDILEVIREL